ncbi:YihY family inner membrane protein [Permianibacter sp. IMCC34836]|uniref:YihY family inner membrane protein n=1 Tax=Permianibacter fluminis TaxID=2738515 RepID=UPI001551E99E|nr:YihY family inner membrane protein [Permianibacter fluminis]NQD38344.1 YihY family inner membrane protein [Permianibacter fluminis]
MAERMYWWLGFVRYVWRRYVHDRCQAVAANLTLTGLLALVPLLTVMVSTFKLLPGMKGTRRTMEDFLFDHFVPGAGDTVKTHVLEFVSRASQLKLAGAVILIFTALMLMGTIDRAVNAIWGSRPSRRFGRKWLLYWAILTLGPMLIALSIGLSSYFFSLPYIKEAAGAARSSLTFVVPLLLTTFGFVVLYAWVPNRYVKPRHAWIAAIFAAVLFELAKRGFGLFVTTMPTYKAVFGALAALPILVLWMYLSWSIMLLGAELCHALGVYRPSLGRIRHPFAVALLLLEQVLSGQRKGELCEQDEALLSVGSENAPEVLAELERQGFIGRVGADKLCFARDPDALNLYSLQQHLPWRLPSPQQAAQELGSGHPVIAQLEQLEQATQQVLVAPVRQILR